MLHRIVRKVAELHRSFSFAPPELVSQGRVVTHGLRRGQYSFAASRMPAEMAFGATKISAAFLLTTKFVLGFRSAGQLPLHESFNCSPFCRREFVGYFSGFIQELHPGFSVGLNGQANAGFAICVAQIQAD